MTNNAAEILIIHTANGWYPIEASGKKPLKDEALDHADINRHITRIEDINGTILWREQ